MNKYFIISIKSVIKFILIFFSVFLINFWNQLDKIQQQSIGRESDQMASNFCIQKFKQFIRAFDIFSSSVILRYNEEQEHKTILGGVFSIAIIVIICLLFARMVIETFSLDKYNLQVINNKNLTPTPANLQLNSDRSKFMFGIEILGIDLSDPRSYFDVTLSRQEWNYGKEISRINYDLQRCTLNHWRHFKPLQDSFIQLGVDKWLCPPTNLHNFLMQGKYTSKKFVQYEVRVSPCKNSTRRTCRSPQEIDAFFKTATSNSRNKNIAYFTLYFINPILNPSKKDYIDYYLQDQNYAIFGPNIGSQNYLLFTDYTVNSDSSIFPFEINEEQKGLLVQNTAIKNSFQTNSLETDTKYISLYFAKSSNSLTINRSAQKITTVFAFIEGTIVAFIALFYILKLYASFSFQITLAYNLFQKNNKKRRVVMNQNAQQLAQPRQVPANLQNNMNERAIQQVNMQNAPKKQQDSTDQKEQHEQLSFLSYILYGFYKICTCCGQTVQWQEMNYIQECQTEMKKQLDIRSILNRLAFLEFISTYVLQNFQLETLKELRPKTAEQMKNIRQRCERVMSSQAEVDMNSRTRNRRRRRMNQQNRARQSIESQRQFDRELDRLQRQQYRNQSLRKLKMSAQQGNQLSTKIWKKLIDNPMQNNNNLD